MEFKHNNLKVLCKSNLQQYNDNVISLSLFGSYNTEHWINGRSDIDILVLVKHSDFDIEFDIENYYRSRLKEYFKYDDIHFTFISLRDFDTVFADIYIDFEDKIIFDYESHYDFLMYINKFYRVNDGLIWLIKRDWEEKYGIL